MSISATIKILRSAKMTFFIETIVEYSLITNLGTLYQGKDLVRSSGKHERQVQNQLLLCIYTL